MLIILIQKQWKKIDISAWKKEQATLRQEEAVRATQYDSLREKLNQMLNVKHCIEEVKHENRKKRQSRKKDQPQLD